MIANSIQWLRNAYITTVKKLPPKDKEAYYIRNWIGGRYPKPNSHRLPYFCFPCGQYHTDLAKHDATKKHQRNERRWKKSMGYLY